MMITFQTCPNFVPSLSLFFYWRFAFYWRNFCLRFNFSKQKCLVDWLIFVVLFLNLSLVGFHLNFLKGKKRNKKWHFSFRSTFVVIPSRPGASRMESLRWRALRSTLALLTKTKVLRELSILFSRQPNRFRLTSGACQLGYQLDALK